MTTSIIDRNGNLLTNNNLDIPRGTYSQVSSINKFGRNSAVAIGVQEEIWDGSAAYSYPATALITSLSQTTDQAALRGGLINVQGLDEDWNQVTQIATLDATLTTNVVTLATPLIRCFRALVMSSTAIDSPVRIHNAAETVDYAIIGVGNNQTLMAIYTVPAGKTAFMTNYYAHVNPGTNLDPTSNPIKMWARDNDHSTLALIKHVVGQTSGGFQHFFSPYQKFTEKTDIYLTATPVGKAADVSAGFDLILVDNDRNW